MDVFEKEGRGQSEQTRDEHDDGRGEYGLEVVELGGFHLVLARHDDVAVDGDGAREPGRVDGREREHVVRVEVERGEEAVGERGVQFAHERDQEVDEVVDELDDVGERQRHQVHVGRVLFRVRVDEHVAYVAEYAKAADERHQVQAGDLLTRQKHLLVFVIVALI